MFNLEERDSAGLSVLGCVFLPAYKKCCKYWLPSGTETEIQFCSETAIYICPHCLDLYTYLVTVDIIYPYISGLWGDVNFCRVVMLVLVI